MPRRPPLFRPRVARTARDYAEEGRARSQHATQPEIDRLRKVARWQKVRALILAARPLCVDPYMVHAREGRIEPATEVDHIVPLRQRPDLAYTESNLQGLCHGCHSRKSAQERKEGYGHPYRPD